MLPGYNFPYTESGALNMDWVIEVLQNAQDVVTNKIPGLESAIQALKNADININGRIDEIIKQLDTLIDNKTIMQLVVNAINCAIKMVFFGLTDDGYFVAYIPNSWDCITFGTIMDCDSPDYGRLTLSY